MRGPRALAAAVAILLSASARRAGAVEPEDAWLRGLQSDVSADIAAGRPVVVEVHVPLCDNRVIRCGGRGLGDGEDLRRNLDRVTSEGLAGWMSRPGSGWTLEHRLVGEPLGDPHILELRVWRRELPVPRAWARPGMPARFTVHLVGIAWRGTAIDRALTAYLTDLFTDRPRVVCYPLRYGAGPASLNAGGASRIVAWVGTYNRLMDVAPDWMALRRARADTFRKGTLAIACYSADRIFAPRRSRRAAFRCC